MAITLFIRPIWRLVRELLPEVEQSMFLLSDQKITPAAWSHYLIWFIQSTLMAYIMGMPERVHPKINATFFWIWAALLIGYVFFYRLEADSYGLITINTVGFAIFVHVAWRYGRIDTD